MRDEPLDDVDRGVLHLLQQDARTLTPVEMAKQLPVTDGTVRNRIERMEAEGVITGYVPVLDYEAAGFPLQVVFTCTAPAGDQADLADQAMQVHRVVNVREMIDWEGNVDVVAIATELEDLLAVAAELTDLGLSIQRQRLVRREYDRPFNHFGEGAVEGD